MQCWEWTGTRQTQGYGKIINEYGQLETTHRVAWRLFRSPIPKGMLICHHCDNPPCVNPDHLFVGTHHDNMADCMAKGRQDGGRGEGHGCAKLNENQVREIRRLSRELPTKEIAARFRISLALVGFIRLRKRWKDVADVAG